MSKINFNIQINPADFHDTEAVVSFIQDIKNAFPDIDVLKQRVTPTPVEGGPLAEHWLKESGSTRIRRTDGRSAEDQAAHNLRSYKGYSEDDLDAVRNGTFVGKGVDSDEESITVDEEDEKSLTEQDLF